MTTSDQASTLGVTTLAGSEFDPLFQALWNHDSIGLVLVNTQGLILKANSAYGRFLGYDPADLPGRFLAEFIHPGDATLDRDQFRSLGVGKLQRYSLEQRYVRQDGATTRGRLTASLIPGGQGGSTTALMVYENLNDAISQRLQAEARLCHGTLHDGLTGLPNPYLLIQTLKTAIKQGRRYNSPRHTLLLLDFDAFKAINDQGRHYIDDQAVGDPVLIAMAAKLKSLVRETDLVAQLEGNKFVILLEDDEPMKGAIRTADRLFADLQAPLTLGDRDVFLSASIGIVLVTPTYSRVDDLLRDANIAMGRAKSRGKNRYEVFDADLHAYALQRLHLETDLHQALVHQELVVYYQPIVSLQTAQLEGFEALVRWQHPGRGLVGPMEFVTVAEDIGLIIAIDRWVLNTVCQQLAAWHQGIPALAGLRASVNLSVQDLWNIHLIDDIDDILAQTGLPGHCLTLEITETMLITNMATTTDLIHQLRQRGIHISIDDFGTGYSSLSYLHQLPSDALKIDRSFISQMLQSPKNYKIVETILTLSHQLGLEVVAEGIETADQLQALSQLGCSYGQGNWFASPLTAKEVADYLNNYKF